MKIRLINFNMKWYKWIYNLDEMNNDKNGDKFFKCNKILKMKEWYEMDNVLMDIRNKLL